MPPRPSFLRLGRLAAEQGGLLTREQLLAEVHPRTVRRWVDDGTLALVQTRVYAITGAPASRDRAIRAACLGAGTFAAAGYRSAAVLLGLDGIRARRPELVCHADQHVQGGPALVHRSRDLRADDVTAVRGIPCTNAARTLLDLGAVVRGRVLETALDDALRRKLCTLAELERRFREVSRPGRVGCGLLRPLLEERLDKHLAPATGFEHRMLALIRRAGLPEPVRQHRIELPGGGHAFADLAWPAIGLIVECDDLATHFAAHRLRADDTRQNELVRLGWTVLRFTWADVVDQPHRTIEVLRDVHRRCTLARSA